MIELIMALQWWKELQKFWNGKHNFSKTSELKYPKKQFKRHKEQYSWK